MKKTIIAFLALAAFAFPAIAQDATIKAWPVYAIAGAPTNGTNEVDTLAIQSSTSGGTFTITVAGGRTTHPIAWSATNATLVANVDAALEALPNIGTGGVTTAVGTMTAGIGTITITFNGAKTAATDVPALSIGTNSLTGGAAPTLTTTTAGVAATYKDARPGTILVDNTTPGLYFNTSATQGAPAWTAVTIP
jgi:hypothetical protein